MKQKILEKFEEQKGIMQQQIAINIIIRLQRLNPDLQLDPVLLAFFVCLCTSGETKVEKMKQRMMSTLKIVKKILDGFCNLF
ncbi:hypothetical protein P3L10_028240 [Capsicum annuum]